MSDSGKVRHGLLAGGNWILDHVKLIDAWPEQDALATIVDESWGNGGSPYNILKDLARLEAPFPLEAVGLVGDDTGGRRIQGDCHAHKIDTSQLRVTAAAPTSYTDVMTVKGTGRRTFFHQRGANALLDVEHFDFSRTRAKIFHLGYLLLLDRLDTVAGGVPRACEVLKRAIEAGMQTSLDCVSEASQRFQTIVIPALPLVDTLFVNDFEAEKLTGISLKRSGRIATEAIVSAGRALLQAGVRRWVVIHHPQAAYACGVDGQEVWQPSVTVPPGEIAGAAGAGDALAAGVLLGMHEQRPMTECVRLGVCAAAASLYHPTCSEGVMQADVCLNLGMRLGFQTGPEVIQKTSASRRISSEKY